MLLWVETFIYKLSERGIFAKETDKKREVDVYMIFCIPIKFSGKYGRMGGQLSGMWLATATVSCLAT